MKFEKFVIPTILVLVITAWLASPFILEYTIEKDDSRGTFGDSYGALNSLFSGLAFAGVIIAILLQKNELKLQREELNLTRKELARSAVAQENSGSYLEEQSLVLSNTAKLNGLASLIQARSDQIQHLNEITARNGLESLSEVWNERARESLVNKREHDIEQLEALMDELFTDHNEI